MCGIFGYFNFLDKKTQAEIIQILLNCIRNLTYRGNDSIGISFDETIDCQRRPVIIKTPGCMNEIKEMVEPFLTNTELINHWGIAHTRWATHGIPSQYNSHPHFSSERLEFTCVHNGAIFNFIELRDFLISVGYAKLVEHAKPRPDVPEPGVVIRQSTQKVDLPYILYSDTDSELVVKLTNYVYEHIKDKNPSFPAVIANSFRFVEGSGSLLYKSAYYPNEGVACRYCTPLVLGLKFSNKNHPTTFYPKKITGLSPMHITNMKDDFITFASDMENPTIKCDSVFVASDAQSFSQYCDDVIFLENWDIVHITPKGVNIFNISNNDSSPERKLIHVQPAPIFPEVDNSKFTYCEIGQEAEAADILIERYIKDDKILIPEIENVNFEDKSRILLFGSGSSNNACLCVSKLFEDCFPEKIIQVMLPSSFNESGIRVGDKDLAIFVSQSGETGDVINACRKCKAKGVYTICITNTHGATLPRLVDLPIYLDIGVERGVASTKTFAANLTFLSLFAIKSKPIVPVSEIRKIPSLMREALESARKSVDAEAKSIASHESVVCCGRGSAHGVALEAAIKFTTLCYQSALGMHEGELKHGPLALMVESACVVFIATPFEGVVAGDFLGTLSQVQARGGRPLVVCFEEDRSLFEGYSRSQLVVPRADERLQAMVTGVAIHALAERVSRERGVVTDRPRNLAKCATID